MSSNQPTSSTNSASNQPAPPSAQQIPQQPLQSPQQPPSQNIKSKTPQKSSSKKPSSKKSTPGKSSKSLSSLSSSKVSKNNAPSLEVDSKGIPIDYKDPITQLIMSDPVSTAAGSTYERESIERWLDSSETDPSTGIKLKTKLVFPNNALKNQITLFLERKPQLKEFLYAQGEYTLERIENLLKEENMIHEVTKLIRKSSNLFKKDTKQNILHIVFQHARSVEYITKILEQQVIVPQINKLLYQRDVHGHTPLTLGVQNSSFEVFRYVVTNHKDVLLNEKRVNKMEAFPEDVRYRLSEHLMDSCSDGFLDGVRVLHHFGVDLQVKVDNVDFFPIEEAAYYGHSPIITFICNSVNVSPNEINRAFGAAAEGHHVDCLQVCLNLGANIDSSPDQLPCPLTRSVGSLQTVQFLVEHGAQINVTHPAVNEEPANPLSAAAQMPDPTLEEEYLRVMDYLLEKGANIDYQDNRGWAAIHYAVRSLHKKSIGKLIENECNVDLQTEDRKSVYDLADDYDDSESLGEEDSTISEALIQDGGEPMDDEDDIVVEEDIDLPPGRHSTHSGRSGRDNDRSREEHYHFFVDDGMEEQMFMGDHDGSEGMSSEFSEDSQSIKDFIREHSKLVKRLRQGMLKKDISVLSTEMGALKKQHEKVFDILKQQGDLLTKLLARGSENSAAQHGTEPTSPGVQGGMSDGEFANVQSTSVKKRKRKKSMGGNQKKKKRSSTESNK